MPPGESRVFSLRTGAFGVTEADTWSENFSWLTWAWFAQRRGSLAVEGDEGFDVAEAVAYGS